MFKKKPLLVFIAIPIMLLGILQSAGAKSKEQENKQTAKEPFYVATPNRRLDEGEGPFSHLILRNAMVIDGTGAPALGPMDVIIEGNRIVEMHRVTDLYSVKERRNYEGAKEVDVGGAYVLPGFVDLHTHIVGTEKTVPAEYAYKLWLAHGITTVRGVPIGEMEWTLKEKSRSEKNEIVAPRIIAFQPPGSGKKWKDRKILSEKDAREWVRYAKKRGLDGIKTYDALMLPPNILAAIWDEAKKQKMGSTAHLGQMGVAQIDVRDAARLGLSGMTHFYGLFEALYKDTTIQPFPIGYNYDDEQDRFSQVARQWNLIHERGSKEWNALLDELLALDFYINPTLTIYSANRDQMRARNADWHELYTMPSQQKFYQASRKNHGSYFYNWTTADEIAWKNFYRVWMQFLNDYKNKGGKVTLGSDSGFIYQLYGFGAIQELELLQEAGFNPLEVIRAATMHSAMEVAKPTGKPIQFGVLRPGMLADMLVVEGNPLENMKLLYGTGALKLNDDTGELERIGGVKYTIKDGIIYDAKKLLKDVEQMVVAAKAKAGSNK